MFLKILFLMSVLVGVTFNIFSEDYSGKVKNLYVNSSGTVLVNIDNGKTGLNCAGGVWPLTFKIDDIAANQWMSLLITARVQNKKIYVGYAANNTGRCSVSYFYFYGFDK